VLTSFCTACRKVPVPVDYRFEFWPKILGGLCVELKRRGKTERDPPYNTNTHALRKVTHGTPSPPPPPPHPKKRCFCLECFKSKYLYTDDFLVSSFFFQCCRYGCYRSLIKLASCIQILSAILNSGSVSLLQYLSKVKEVSGHLNFFYNI
jgi:hypothetical protein